MKILVTGATGFIGKNLVLQLKSKGYTELLECGSSTPASLLSQYAEECGFVFHLAGVNRPEAESEFMAGNAGFTAVLLGRLKSNGSKAPVLYASSVQAALDNAYGRSKKAGEDLVFEYGRANDVPVYVYRLPNVFGKWCRPNYNSVVATFCNNIANGRELTVNDPQTIMALAYIDDVAAEFIRALEGCKNRLENGFCAVAKTSTVKLGALAEKLLAFAANRESLVMPSLESDFDRALYATYLSYLPQDDFAYPLCQKSDCRGYLAEFIRTQSAGQLFVSSTKPGVTRGNHWHHSKTEKFLVLQGQAVIALRRVNSDEVLEYPVCGKTLRVVDIPPGYAHSIQNTGSGELITLFWASEAFSPERPDTYPMNVYTASGETICKS